MRSTGVGVVDVHLQCAGVSIQQKGPVGPGQDLLVVLGGLSEGVSPCSGRASFEGPDGAVGDWVIDLNVAVLPHLGFEVRREDVDRVARTAVLHPSRPLARVAARLVGPEGVDLGPVAVDLTDPSAPVLRWTTAEEIVRIDVEAADASNFGAQLELSPWSYIIPHADIEFATGDHAISAAEAPKLEATLVELNKVLARYGSVVRVQLFIAGYTDTVGEHAMNQALSERRARSIAAWFCGRGVDLPISYQGFGERVLAVLTGDEVDEPRNRRAVYVLAADAPTGVADLPGAAWRRL
jgi:outer membrane protein OmpA-like peptidoglycan-associated protein